MTVLIHGKEYVTCAERLELVHKSGKAFQVLESSPLQVGERVLWRCVITIDNLQYIGTAEAKVSNARKGSPDDSNPYECSETSALARALGIAGFGAPDSVCSADEIVRSQPQQQQQAKEPSRLEQLYQRGRTTQAWNDRQAMLNRMSLILDAPISRENLAELTDDLLALVEQAIAEPAATF